MRKHLILAGALALTLAAPAAQAQSAPAAPQVSVTNVAANVNITPKRVYLDKGRRSGTVFVINQGSEPVTVDITLVDRVMTPDGQILSADVAQKPEYKAYGDRLKSAKEMVEVSPRRVALGPGKGQVVRLRLGALPEAAGEYRTHLTVTTIPPRDSGTTAEAAASGATHNELRFQINAVYGLSIPVIVRNGATDARAEIEHARLETIQVPASPQGPAHAAPVVALDLVRVGPTSLFGNLEVRTAGAKKGAEPIGAARGLGVYPEIDRRTVRIPLTRAPAPGEKLEVTFTDDDTSPGKVLAKSTL